MTATDRTCFACGRECEPSPYGPPWCGRCAARDYAEQLEDKAAASDDSADLLRNRRLRRAGTVPVAGEPRRTSWR